MSDINEYRQGYEAGVKSGAITAGTDFLDVMLKSDAWSKGFLDGSAKKPFNPPPPKPTPKEAAPPAPTPSPQPSYTYSEYPPGYEWLAGETEEFRA